MQWTGLPFETLALAGGTAALVLTVLYLLKLRKRRVQVPFSPLWGRVVQEYRQQADWWRRLRRLLSWLVAMLVLCALIFALADPHPAGEVTTGRHLVLLVDSSASMASTDVSGGANRLDLAKKKAQEILDTMGAEDRVMLVNFNAQLQPLSPFVSSPELLTQALREIKVAATGTGFEDALRFAADALRDKKNGECIVLSDGAGFEEGTLQGVAFAPSTTLRHVQVGEGGGNVALTAFSARRYMANKLDYELFARIENQFERPVDVELQLWADGRVVDVTTLQIPAKGAHQQFFPSQAVSGSELEARLKLLTSDARDVFPEDDRAYALLPVVKPSKVLLVTPGNLYLEGTLLLNSNIDLTRITPAEYSPQTHADFDVVFIDRVIPPVLAEQGNFVLVDPSGEASPWTVTGQIPRPIITSYKKSHPLMRWIGMVDVNIGSGSRLALERGDDVVASAFGVPMVIVREGAKRRFVALAFDVRNSDLPLRVAFPVLMINLIDYFQLDDQQLLQNFITGQTWSIRVLDEQGEATVVRPDGTSQSLPIYNNRVVVYGNQTGFYTLKTPAGEQHVAGNLSDSVESRIAPKAIVVGDAAQNKAADGLFFDRKELWIWAVIAALIVLLVEWVTYHRRWTV